MRLLTFSVALLGLLWTAYSLYFFHVSWPIRDFNAFYLSATDFWHGGSLYARPHVYISLNAPHPVFAADSALISSFCAVADPLDALHRCCVTDYPEGSVGPQIALATLARGSLCLLCPATSMEASASRWLVSCRISWTYYLLISIGLPTVVFFHPVNDPDLRNDVLWANHVDIRSDRRLVETLPGRTGYVLTWAPECDVTLVPLAGLQ
jgi:hypothetical protein